MDAVEYYVENYGEFLWQVLLPIFMMLALVLGFIILLFKRFTFGHWTKEHPNPYESETFGMPRGTFRGILTLCMLWLIVILELVNVRIIGFETEIAELMVAFQMVVGFYFGAKVMHHVTSQDTKKAKALAGVTDETASTATATDESGGEVTSNEEAVG